MSNFRAGTPFRAAMMMAAAMSAVIQATAGNFAAQKAGVAELGPYQGRGKGKTRTHDGGGTRAFQRGSLKKRNQARHRKACRG